MTEDEVIHVVEAWRAEHLKGVPVTQLLLDWQILARHVGRDIGGLQVTELQELQSESQQLVRPVLRELQRSGRLHGVLPNGSGVQP